MHGYLGESFKPLTLGTFKENDSQFSVEIHGSGLNKLISNWSMRKKEKTKNSGRSNKLFTSAGNEDSRETPGSLRFSSSEMLCFY